MAMILAFAFVAGASAQGIEVVKYGDGTVQEPTPAPVQGTLPAVIQTPTGNNIIINQYSTNYQFSIGAENPAPSVCLCSNTYDRVRVTNTAPMEGTFTFITSIPEYAKLPYSAIKIGAGQSVDLLILISADCSQKDGTFDYNILVTNSFGARYTIERQLYVKRCQSIAATLYTSANSIKPCEKVNYTIGLKNPAPFTEQYAVKPRNPEFFGNVQYEVTLAPSQTAYMNFTYTPSCGTYGEDDVKFDVQSVNNNLKGTLTHGLLIDRAYDFGIIAPSDVQLCRTDVVNIPVTVRNLAEMENNFTLTMLSKPDFLVLQNGFTTIKPGEDKTFIVTAYPSAKTKNPQKLEFEVRTALGDVSKRISIPLAVNTCYGLSLDIQAETNPELCAGTYTYDATVQNRGTKTETVLLTASSRDAEVFQSSITLAPSESRNVSLALSLPDENAKRLSYTLNAKTADEKADASDTLTVGVVRKYECTRLEFSRSRLYARYGTQNATFSVKNTGTMPARYDVSYEGSDWISLETTKATLKPGQSKQVMLSLYSDNSTPAKLYSFKVTGEARETGAAYENNMTLRMTNVPFIEKLYGLATSTVCSTVTSILLILLVLGVIATLILAWKRVSVPLAFKLIALGLIVLVVVLVLVMKGFPDSRYPAIDRTQINNSHIILYENHKYKVQLQDRYFYDPDNDVLNFSVSNMPDNITIRINGSKAVIIPDRDWFGTARIRFVADDGYGGVTESERVEIEVVEVPRFSWKEWYYRNCTYINAVLLMLFFALVLVLRTRKEKAPLSRKVHFAGIRKEKGYLYFVDRDGDVSRAPMARADRKKQKFRKEKVGRTAAVRKRR
jgi:uncharacterized membrane protein